MAFWAPLLQSYLHRLLLKYLPPICTLSVKLSPATPLFQRIFLFSSGYILLFKSRFVNPHLNRGMKLASSATYRAYHFIPDKHLSDASALFSLPRLSAPVPSSFSLFRHHMPLKLHRYKSPTNGTALWHQKSPIRHRSF